MLYFYSCRAILEGSKDFYGCGTITVEKPIETAEEYNSIVMRDLRTDILNRLKVKYPSLNLDKIIFTAFNRI